jgi:Ca2+-binding RTX toxin-like protein
MSDVEVLTGGAAADVLAGGAGDDDLSGAGGDDRLLSSGGRDDVAGGPGRDTLDLSAFRQRLFVQLADGVGSAPLTSTPRGDHTRIATTSRTSSAGGVPTR